MKFIFFWLAGLILLYRRDQYRSYGTVSYLHIPGGRVPENISTEPGVRRPIAIPLQGNDSLGLPEIPEEGPDLFGQ